MTTTPHGQVPEALIDLIDAYAETRHRCGGIYNARTEAARKAVIEALSGVQALSAAPETIAKLRHLYQNMVNGAVRDTASAKRIAEGLLAPAIEALERATPPAEQQVIIDFAQVGTAGPFHVVNGRVKLPDATMQDLARMLRPTYEAEQATPKAAPVVWLSSKQLRGVTALHGQYLPFRCQPEGRFDTPVYLVEAAPKAAPGDVLDEALRERDEAEDFINELLDEVLGADRPEWSSAYNRYDAMSDVRERITVLHKPAVDKAWGQFQSAMAAPQQEAQEPAFWMNEKGHTWSHSDWKQFPKHRAKYPIPLYPHFPAPQPAPAPMSRDQIREVFMAHGFTIKEGQTDLKQYVYDAAYALLGTKPAPLSGDVMKDAARYRWLRATTNFATNSQGERIDVRNQPEKWDAAIDAALAAQGGD